MGKKTRVIYFCDNCETNVESEDDLYKCNKCGAEICADCSEIASLKFYLDSSDDKERIASNLYCGNCLMKFSTGDLVNVLADELIRGIGGTSLKTSD